MTLVDMCICRVEGSKYLVIIFVILCLYQQRLCSERESVLNCMTLQYHDIFVRETFFTNCRLRGWTLACM